MANIANELNMITTTFERVSDSIYDSVLENVAMFKWLDAKGKIQDIDGGRYVEESVSLLENTNFDWQDPDEDTATDRVQVLNRAVYDWKYIPGNIVVTGAELRNNSRRHEKHNLLKALVEVAKSTVYNKVGLALFNNSQTGVAKSLVGLGEMVTADGTGTLGGIDPVTYPIWKNQFKVGAATVPATTSEQFLADMTEVFNDCTFGASKPDFIVTNSEMRAKYEAACQEQKRFGYTKNNKAADLGFQAFDFNGAALIFDTNCPDDTMYFLNTDYLGVYFHKDAKMTLGQKAKSEGNDRYLWMLLTQMAFTCRGRKFQGILTYPAA